MIREEAEKVNEIDKIIFEELQNKLKIKKDKYKVYPVYYPVGNGIFNIDKSIEDIKWIIDEELIGD